MIATVPYVEKKIGEYNALIFNSELPPVPVKLTRARTFLGKMCYKKNCDRRGKRTGCSNFVMRISVLFDLPEDMLDDVIIHEMIHYYIAYKNIPDSSMHGPVFRSYMNDINERFGRHIETRHKSTVEQKAPQTAVRKAHYICVSELENGTTGVTVCAKTKVFELYRLLPKHYRIRNMTWYGSFDPFFDHLPRSRTPKMYRIPQDQLEEHLASSVKMVCDGKFLRKANP